MSVTSFVSGSALFLALWLGVTFFHEVSPLQNPNPPKTASSAKAVPVPTPASDQDTALASCDP